MDTMEKIRFEPPEVFEPTEIQIDILRAVAGLRSCHIRDVVQMLQGTRSESSVRSGVHTLLAKGCLDAGKATSEIVLRLTSRGRILLQPPKAS
ncbi:MAG: hypothetical protein A4E35_00758 [Methanoregula sp. PtaU1.Bin051]|nr:MAG: hypothetical protein A4E35_00758 [Methanoregula sp. PtaU1.Bin051]